MDTVISLLILSTLPQLVTSQAESLNSPGAVAEIVSGHSTIFSGESVRLKCSILDHRSTWDYMWFKGSEQVPHQGQNLTLWGAHIKDSGKYYCQGVRDTAVGKIHTLQSGPVEIDVEGGWAILQVPPAPSLVAQTLKLTCRVRGNPQLHEVILYKHGVEVMRRTGPNLDFYLTNLAVKDQGMYSCRASWDIERRTRSVISVETLVQVVEILSEPVLEIVANSNHMQATMMQLICHHEYNAPAPAPPLNYYFYKDNVKLGVSLSENQQLVRRAPGWYSCKVRVPELGLVKLSDRKRYGRPPEQQMPKPQIPRPRIPLVRAPTITSPEPSVPPVAEPTAATPSPHHSTAAPTFSKPTEVSTFSSSPPSSKLEPSTLPSMTYALNQTASYQTFNTAEESGDMSGESGDMPEESGGVPDTVPV